MKPNTKWSDLPNAHHIDWVLASLKDNPDLWTAASNTARAAARGTVWYATWTSARGTAWYATWTSARDAAYNAARDAAEWSRPRRNEWASVEAATREAARGAAWDSAWYAARDAILALVAYDDCDQYLSMSYEELTIWAVLSEHPAAILLLPMIYVREKIQESELVS